MKKGKTAKALKLGLKILFGIFVFAFLALFVASKVTTSPIFLFNKTTMWVMTQSMDPTIPPRTYILVEKATADDVNVGDVIVFRSTDPRIKGNFNTHRIIAKSGNTIVTKGDNNDQDDGIYSAKPEDVVGRYVRKIGFLTFLGRIVMTPIGFAILLILFIITMSFSVFPDVKEAIAAKTEDDEKKKSDEIRRLIEEEVQRLKESGAGLEDLPQTDEKTEKGGE